MIVWKCWGQRRVRVMKEYQEFKEYHKLARSIDVPRRPAGTKSSLRRETRVLLLLHATRQNQFDHLSALRPLHLPEITPKCLPPTRHPIHSQSIKPKPSVSNSRNGKNGSRPTTGDAKRVAKTSSAILKSVNHRFCSKYIKSR